MEWTETLRRTVDYLEAHLLEDGAAEGAAQAVYLSPLYLQITETKFGTETKGWTI